MVATPIGNLGDLSPRARQVLEEADLWVVEDSRKGGVLQAALGIKVPMRVVNDHSPPERLHDVTDLVAAGQTVCLTTDAGTPVVSDPGTEIVDFCLDRGLPVDGVPGPSAVTAALAVSGFFGQRYAFLGFLPRKSGARREALAPLVDSSLAVVIFESPHRITACLEDCGRVLGSRRYAVCRELTKVHQQIWRSRLPQTPGSSDVPAKGEVTIVVEGRRKGLTFAETDQV